MARQRKQRVRAERSAPNRPDKPAAPPAARPVDLKRVLRFFLWGIATVVFLTLTAMSIEHKITWYLAVDQFGYMRFAHDLLDGKVLHEWAPAEALTRWLPKRTDMLAQTYIWDHGRLYSRYAPGFPILLASWIGVFGDGAAHFLNPTLFIVLLLVIIAFGWQLHRSPWRGTLAAALFVLCPTFAHLWALTLTRDLSAHLCAFTGLTLLLTRYRPLGARRVLVAGLFLGFASTIRPDAILYLIPASVIGAWRWAKATGGWPALRRTASAGALGVSIGLAPMLAFNWVATGNPFVPTQSMELNAVFGEKNPWQRSAAEPPQRLATRVGYPSPGWHGGTMRYVQGGALKVSNLPEVLPGNLRKIRSAYGDVLLGAAAIGVIVAAVMRPVLVVAAVPYMVITLLFFSMWTRPDSRYLFGLWVWFPMLIVEGAVGIFDFIRWLWRRQLQEVARGVAVVAAIGLFLGYAMLGPSEPGVLATLTWTFLLLNGAALVTAAVLPGRRLAGVVAPIAMLAVVGLATVEAEESLARRASFQRPQAMRARDVFREYVEADAVVITAEDVGRPMENIEYYGGVHALYLTDLARWRLEMPRLVSVLFQRELRPYFLLPPAMAEPIVTDLRERGFTVDLVADIPPQRNYDFFVAAPFHRGIPMQLHRLSWPVFEEALEQYKAAERAKAATD